MSYQSLPRSRILPLLLTVLFFTGISLPRGGARPPISSSNISQQFQRIAPGIEYQQITRGNASQDDTSGPLSINLLRVDLEQATVKVFHALDEGVGLETVSSLASRHNALAAVNGGYFRTSGTFRGESVGTLMLEGRLISEPYRERAAIGFIQHSGATEVVFGHLKFNAQISSRGSSHHVDGLNRPLTGEELVVFTPQFHRTTLTSTEGIEVVVRANRVVSVRDHQGSSEIPAQGYVISAIGKAREWLLKSVRRGTKITFSWRLTSLNDQQEKQWHRAHTILGAGPQLINDGKIAITDAQERMAPGFATDRHPRTAIARMASGKLLLLTVDGRQPGISIGMSLSKLAELLMEFGAVEAVNLDGGGSTTMFVRDKVVNRPSDQTGERPVSDAILIFSKGN